MKNVKKSFSQVVKEKKGNFNKPKRKKKNVAVGAVMHKICNIIFAMLRDNKPFEVITPQEHCERFTAGSRPK